MPAHLHHVSVFVKDMERSLDLYQGLLGMDVIQHLPVVKGSRISKLLGISDFEAEMVFLKHPDQQVCLELVRQFGGWDKQGQPAAGYGVGLSLTVTDLDGLHARLSQAGWSPISEPMEMPDPAGRSVRLFCFHTDEGLPVELIEQVAT